MTEAESHTDSFQAFRYDAQDNQSSKLNAYTKNELLYHVRQCKESKLIDSYEEFGGGDIIYISDLTPTGHEFLASIKDPDLWTKVKERFSELGSHALPHLIQMALNYFGSILGEFLG